MTDLDEEHCDLGDNENTAGTDIGTQKNPRASLEIIVGSLHRLNNVDVVGRVSKEKKETDKIQDSTLLWVQKQEIDRRSRD